MIECLLPGCSRWVRAPTRKLGAQQVTYEADESSRSEMEMLDDFDRKAWLCARGDQRVAAGRRLKWTPGFKGFLPGRWLDA